MQESEKELVSTIMAQINPATFSLLRYGTPPATIGDLLKLAGDVDGAALRHLMYTDAMGSPTHANDPEAAEPTQRNFGQRAAKESTVKPTALGTKASTSSFKTPPLPPAPCPRRYPIVCYRCGVSGHVAARCSRA
jgi:hypothetical protein